MGQRGVVPNSSLSETVYYQIVLLSEIDLILSCIIRHYEIKAFSYEFVLTKKGRYYSTIPCKWILIFVFFIIFLYSLVFIFLIDLLWAPNTSNFLAWGCLSGSYWSVSSVLSKYFSKNLLTLLLKYSILRTKYVKCFSIDSPQIFSSSFKIKF